MKYTFETLKARTIEDGDCWVWTGYLSSGTPQVKDTELGKMVSARGLMAVLSGKNKRHGNGSWTARCYNRSCINPDHAVYMLKRDQLSAAARTKSAQSEQIRKAKISKAFQKVPQETIMLFLSSPKTSKELAAETGWSVSTVKKYRAGKLGVTSNTNFWAGLFRTS